MTQQTGRGWCPFAIHKPIPETYTQNAIEPRISILHSAGGSAELEGWWNNPQSKGLESHSFVDDETYIDPADGLEYAKLYQYVNIFVQADANREANDIAVSTETASTVNAAEPWSPPQVRTIVRWLVWCSTEAPAIKAQLCPSPRGSGIGWHIMFGAPGPWTPARGKVCPGPARIKQVPGIIAEVQRKLSNPTEPPKGWLMALTDKEQEELLTKVRELHDDYAVKVAPGGKHPRTKKVIEFGTKAFQIGRTFNSVDDLRALLPTKKG